MTGWPPPAKGGRGITPPELPLGLPGGFAIVPVPAPPPLGPGRPGGLGSGFPAAPVPEPPPVDPPPIGAAPRVKAPDDDGPGDGPVPIRPDGPPAAPGAVNVGRDRFPPDCPACGGCGVFDAPEDIRDNDRGGDDGLPIPERGKVGGAEVPPPVVARPVPAGVENDGAEGVRATLPGVPGLPCAAVLTLKLDPPPLVDVSADNPPAPP